MCSVCVNGGRSKQANVTFDVVLHVAVVPKASRWESKAVFTRAYQYCVGIAEFAGLEFAGLENDGVEQEETYILHTMKWTQTNVYDT